VSKGKYLCTRMTLAWIYRGRYASILFLPPNYYQQAGHFIVTVSNKKKQGAFKFGTPDISAI
jgi:hypothetical protein